jgi:hypothetical protein
LEFDNETVKFTAEVYIYRKFLKHMTIFFSRKLVLLCAATGIIYAAGCALPPKTPREILNAGQGDKIYLSHNLWFEKADEIPIENHHKGQIIPAGTEVEILDYTDDDIVFSETASGKKYKILYNRERTMTPSHNYIPTFFTIKNPLEGKSDELISAIKAGKICKGMSKDDVSTSWGSPMPHRTQDKINNDTWIYWDDLHKSKRAVFKNGKLLEIME